MNKSAFCCGLVTFNEEILNGKLHFLRNVDKTDGSHEYIITVWKSDYSINSWGMAKSTAVHRMKNADLSV